MKLLVADDDQMSLVMMRRMLHRNGYDVVTATNGPAAVEKILEENAPRLVLLDWMMPGLDGPDVCQAIRNREGCPYVYIILLTARDSKEDLVAGLHSGADDYITKPFHPEELQARLRTGTRILDLQDSLVDARDQMRFRATHDSLTRLLNRGAVVHALANACQIRADVGEQISLLLCDVDHFKSINDTRGHPVGDDVLREVARRVASVARAGDSVGRFGGEEFLLVLRNSGPAELHARAEALCYAVRGLAVQTSAGALPVTVSAGAISLCELGAEATVDSALQQADLLLYRAKTSGRDRAITSSITACSPSSSTCSVGAQLATIRNAAIAA